LADNPTLLAILAHPDDESLVAGGTLARFAAAGMRVALLCATRGEWGPISDERLANYETLGKVREQELRDACEVLGVSWMRFLDLPDGGVRWAIEDETFGALGKVVAAVQELKPAAIITFGPDGYYGHDDHIAIGELTTAVVAASPETHRLYYAVQPQGLMTSLVEQLRMAGLPTDLWDIPAEEFGVAENLINTEIDVHCFVDRKLAALRCHRTQMPDNHALKSIPSAIAEAFLGVEYFQLVNAVPARVPLTTLIDRLD
jgi:N-acetyl-1-D-myo-inositol-2-amino-2-deoxy-alpha-D-glucopyranoside deacetylase